MKELQERIQRDGRVLSSTVIKVDSFLNHQVDPQLTMHIGRTFADLFADAFPGQVTKVLTIEASGIHFALATSLHLGVPFVYAKKKKAVTQSEDIYSAEVFSYTRNESYPITLTKRFLGNQDRVVIIDDILANGEAILGLTEMIKQSGATLLGVGVVIEKSFQEGRKKLDEAGVPVFALARIADMSNGTILFVNEESKEEVFHAQ